MSCQVNTEAHGFSEACRNGKTAFMVMDKVIIYDKPPGKFDSIPTHQDINEDDEVIINDRYK